MICCFFWPRVRLTSYFGLCIQEDDSSQNQKDTGP